MASFYINVEYIDSDAETAEEAAESFKQWVNSGIEVTVAPYDEDSGEVDGRAVEVRI